MTIPLIDWIGRRNPAEHIGYTSVSVAAVTIDSSHLNTQDTIIACLQWSKHQVVPHKWLDLLAKS